MGTTDDAAPDLSWVTPDLAVGGRFGPAAAAVLAVRHDIRRVVDLRAEEQDDPAALRCHRVECLHLPTPDHHPVAPTMLSAGVAWVQEGLSRGERVLIHCEHGIGRSILLACCVLVSRGDSPRAALERIKAAREKASPSPAQLHALLDWSAAWHRGRQTPPPADTWDELARVAYRHLARLNDAGAGP